MPRCPALGCPGQWERGGESGDGTGAWGCDACARRRQWVFWVPQLPETSRAPSQRWSAGIVCVVALHDCILFSLGLFLLPCVTL